MKDTLEKRCETYCSFRDRYGVLIALVVKISPKGLIDFVKTVAGRVKFSFSLILPVVFTCKMVLYGGSKSNVQTNEPSVSVRPCVQQEIGKESQSKRSRSVLSSEAVPSFATNFYSRVEKWYRRGALDDGHMVRFDRDWCFPYGTGHLSQVEVWSSGGIYPTEKSAVPIALLATSLSLRPLCTEVFVRRTTNNAYRVEWNRAYPNRDPSQTVDAAIDLFRNGTVVVTEGGTTREIPYSIPFDHEGLGQDEDWVRSYIRRFKDLTTESLDVQEIISVGYQNWVRQTVSGNSPNGLFCLNVSFGQAPPEVVRLSVGPYVVAVTTSGNYTFLLEKGECYDIGVSFVAPGVVYSCFDSDEAGQQHRAATKSGHSIASSDNVQTIVTSEGCYDDVELVTPTPSQPVGHVTWLPRLTLSPSQCVNPSYPILFNAFVDLPMGAIPRVQWDLSDGSSVGEGEWVSIDEAALREGVRVHASYRSIDLYGHVSLRQVVSNTRIELSPVPLIVFEGPYTNSPDETVRVSSSMVRMTASWELAVPGRLFLESIGTMPLEVRVDNEEGPVASFPYEIGRFDQNAIGSRDFFLFCRGVVGDGNVGSYRLRLVPAEGAEIRASSSVSAAKIQVEADSTWPANKVRHVFGPKEKAYVKTLSGANMALSVDTSNTSTTVGCDAKGWYFIAPERGGKFSVLATVGNTPYSIDCRCVLPTCLKGSSPRALDRFEYLTLGVPPLVLGEAGVVMHIDTYLEPNYVSFGNLRLFEGYAPPTGRSGWYLDQVKFPDSLLAHSASAGASLDPGNEYATICDDNKTINGDYVGGVIGSSSVYSNGSYRLNIPLYWYVAGGSETNRLPDNVQTIWVYDNGTMRVNKNGMTWQRDLSGMESSP